MKDDSEKTQVRKLNNLIGEGAVKRNAYLIVLSGSEIGRMLRLKAGKTTIGRSRSCTFLIEEEGISRLHAEVHIDEKGQPTVRDAGSTNGTLVNGRSVLKGIQPLEDGDRIQVGGAVILKFSYQDHLEESFQQRLYSSAVRDPLTGAYNKRYLTERLEQEFAHADRRNVPLSLVVVDLDHFKRINDEYGHACGDEVLRMVAQHVEKHLRREEIFARYGGEEFVILMRETNLESAMRAAERIRRLIQGLSIPFSDKVLRVTASLGVSSTDGAWHKNALRLFISADRQLYRAKNLGRNTVCGPDGESTDTV
jgi:diguanylate cyclase (GGDEF)-like protein